MQCPQNELERKQIKNFLCINCGELDVCSNLYQAKHQFCFGMLDRYQSNPGLDHRKAAKKVLRYLQGTKNHMLTYRRFDHLEVIGYSDSDFVVCVDTRKSTFGNLFFLAEGAI